MEILAYIVFGFLVIRTAITMVNYRSAFLPGSDAPGGEGDDAMVSVIIPARNEERNIGYLLEQLIFSRHADLEILVYDDLSADRTSDVVREFERNDSRVKLVEGEPLPEGWLGKSYACHSAAQKAKGDYLIFLDADVEVRNDLIGMTVSSMRSQNLDMLSLFPVQKMGSPGEWFTVPLMNWILLSLLPLPLTLKSKWKTFSAANGQFMLFKGDIYRNNRFHEKVKSEKAEDIAIMKFMKGEGMKSRTFLSRGEIYCRMYQGYADAISGFSKNIIEIFGNNISMLLLYLLFTNFGIFAVAFFLPGKMLVIYLFLFMTMRSLVSKLSRQHVLRNIVLSPIQQFSLNLIALKAIRYRFLGGLTWKGRVVDKKR